MPRLPGGIEKAHSALGSLCKPGFPKETELCVHFFSLLQGIGPRGYGE